MQYKYIPRVIVCEKYLEQESARLTDYKVYCFNGKPEAILVMHDRNVGIRSEFFDIEWNDLEMTKYDKPKLKTAKPKSLDKMLAAAKTLSSPFPFVRVDFFIVDEKLIFGELTFTPAGGLYMAQTKIKGKDMGEILTLKEG